MADEFICEGCAYSTQSFEDKCPLCGGRVVSIDDGIDDKAFAESNEEEAKDRNDDFDLDLDELPRAA